MDISKIGAGLLCTLLLCTSHADAKKRGGAEEDEKGLPRISDRVEGLERRDGLLPTYVDAEKAQILLEVPPPAEDGICAELLYVEGLVSGLGSNPVGLDRGQLGSAQLMHLRRVGDRVLFELPNVRFRALSADERERAAVAQSFASSVIWGEKVVARDADGATLIDLTPFLLHDAHAVVARLDERGQGQFTLDETRSAIDLSQALAFPKNLEFEALLTFTSSEPGSEVRAVAPVPESFTLRQHISLIALPGPGYVPRAFDPRAGSFAIEFHDYAAPLGESMTRQWIVRHRLEKTDPSAASSKVVKPIVYYVDSGTPEPVRSALVEGASWWAAAFEAAGFEDAFRVELLPEGAHPMDVRYNVIQWVHRATRGWSYGGGLADPRTGERIQGHVWLGSLRVRQDIRIFEGLAGTEKTGSGAADDPIELALARIRQLSAHEVGHALGLTHNFAASTYDRASVMDYPHPWVKMTPAGALDFSQTYGTGVGAWDVHAIRYAYAQADQASKQRDLLAQILRDAQSKNLLFLSDDDARPAGAAHPLANLWDNGADPIAELESVLAVRKHALDRFGERNVAPGRPSAELEEVLAPIYFFHRYQLQAAAKSIGGLNYRYAIRGDGAPPQSSPTDAATQRRALAAVLSAAHPRRLDVPEPVLDLLLPRAYGMQPNRELFRGHSSLTFDALSAAATAADLVFAELLQPERAQRLIDQHRRDPALPSFHSVLDATLDATFADDSGDPRLDELARVARWALIDRLVGLADGAGSRAVAERAETALRTATQRTASLAGRGALDTDHALSLRAAIDNYLRSRTWTRDELVPPPSAPPGSPIGTDAFCSH